MSSKKIGAKKGRPEEETDFKPGTLPYEFRKARRLAGLTVSQLAKRIRVTHATISQIERGQTAAPSDRTLMLAAKETGSDFGLSWLKEHAKPPTVRKVRVEAYVAAGQPIDEIIEDDFIAVDAESIRLRDDSCALRVKGDSMIEYHILSGDTLIARKTTEPRNRSIVIVDFREGIGACVKFWYRRGDTVRLSSDPDAGEGEKFEYSAAKLGKVYELVGLVRNFKR